MTVGPEGVGGVDGAFGDSEAPAVGEALASLKIGEAGTALGPVDGLVTLATGVAG